MSARDDAANPTKSARPPRVWPGVTVALLAGALLGVGIAGVLAGRFTPNRYPRYEARVRWQGGPPAPAEWPRPARPGEQAVLLERGGSTRLAVRSFSAAGTEALARDLQRRRLSGVDASSARRATARTQWRSSRVLAGPTALTPAGQCAALVRARLLLIALVGPRVSPATPGQSPGSAAARLRMARAEDEVVRVALAVRPDSLASALTVCASAEGEWLRALASEPAADPRERIEAAWRRHERLRAPVLDRVERTLEAALWKSQKDAVVTAACERALVLERLAPDPSAMLFVHGVWVPVPRAFPIARFWIMLFGSGALAGAALGIVPCVLWLRRRSRPRTGQRGAPARSPHTPGQLPRDPRQAWDAELGWLHVVSGPDAARISHAAATLAGGFLERGERVLLVDAGERLRLHERYGADTRWGLGECLAGEVPLLGAVQATGRPGFFFLAHGAPNRAGRWDELSGLLEDARAHFGRVLLALDRRAPRAAALPLGGRVLEAWWAEPGPELPKGAVALSERLGIPFACFDLNWLTQAMLEGEAAAPSQVGDEPAEVQPSGDPGASLVALASQGLGAHAPASLKGAPGPADVVDTAACSDDETMVLDCDLEVRERLRFLIWMRRVQAERQAAALEAGVGR